MHFALNFMKIYQHITLFVIRLFRLQRYAYGSNSPEVVYFGAFDP